MKFGGSLARNDAFGSFFCEKLSEASRETLVLEARSVKFGGSLARNARFGSFCSTGVVRSTGSSVVRSSTGVVLCSTL